MVVEGFAIHLVRSVAGPELVRAASGWSSALGCRKESAPRSTWRG